MRIAVVGAGAMGAVIAAAAVPGGHEVTVCVRTPIESLELSTAADSGLTGGRLDVALLSRPRHVELAAEMVFVTVKATDNDSVVPWLDRLCGPGTLIVVVQNGLDQADRFASCLVSGVTAVPGLAYLAAERLGPGHVRHLSGNLLVVPDAQAGQIAAALPAMKVRGTADMITAGWKKLLGNLVANPITALTMRRIGVMAEPGIADLARGLLQEAVAVGRASGAEVNEDDIEPIVTGAARWGPDTGSSMLYDRLARRPTEHQFLTGEIVRRGRELGIAVPLNAAVLALLDAIDRGRE